MPLCNLNRSAGMKVKIVAHDVNEKQFLTRIIHKCCRALALFALLKAMHHDLL
jgi:hypothetical protein